MLNRRTLLTVVSSLVWLGCTKVPELPPATAFLKDFQLMDRDGKVLSDDWTISLSHPIDPTIQFEPVDPPSELAGRKVTPLDEWIISAHLRDESGQPVPCVGIFKDEKQFGVETLEGQGGPLVWESPEAPQAIKKGVVWQWCHCRAPEAGRYTLVIMLFPTPIRIAMNPNIDHGEGIELARQALTITPGPPPKQGLTMATPGVGQISRAGYHQLRKRFK